eukprot:6993081-Pyramimonas_sp.AAC.1
MGRSLVSADPWEFTRAGGPVSAGTLCSLQGVVGRGIVAIGMESRPLERRSPEAYQASWDAQVAGSL